MCGRVLSTVQLRDGRQAELAHVVASDAPAFLDYVEAVAAESDFLTFGPGESGMTLEQELAFALNDSNARYLICLDELYPIYERVRDQVHVDSK